MADGVIWQRLVFTMLRYGRNCKGMEGVRHVEKDERKDDVTGALQHALPGERDHPLLTGPFSPGSAAAILSVTRPRRAPAAGCSRSGPCG
jgi:hypothetical protein